MDAEDQDRDITLIHQFDTNQHFNDNETYDAFIRHQQQNLRDQLDLSITVENTALENRGDCETQIDG